MNVFESLGRKTAELEALNAEYDRLLQLLAQVCDGTTAASRVRVDIAARSWAIEAADPEEIEAVATP